MRIVLIGGSGQVGAEVALLLAQSQPGEVRPVSRTRSGSAFLRYSGLPVLHGDISDPAQAARLMAGADVVANFALAIGTPAVSLGKNSAIIRQIFEQAPPSATLVFFSTMAVYDYGGRFGGFRNPYEQTKIKNEKLAQELAAKRNRRLYVLRLGHVAGDLQNILPGWHAELADPPVLVPDPDRASNVTYTAAIADALAAIADGRAGPPGLYDLVNFPQWTWREIYQHEATRLGVPLVLEVHDFGAGKAKASLAGSVRAGFGKIAANPAIRPLLERGLALMPVVTNEMAKARYQVSRMYGEIAALADAPVLRNAAAAWPAMPARHLPGLRPTRDVLGLPEFQLKSMIGPRWPADPA